MRLELNTNEDFTGAEFLRGTICAVCDSPIQNPPAIWFMLNSLDLFIHKHCEPGFSDDIVKRELAEWAIVMHDDPPEHN